MCHGVICGLFYRNNRVVTEQKKKELEEEKIMGVALIKAVRISKVVI